MGSNQPNLTMDFEPLSELMADYIGDLDSSSSSSPLQQLYPPRPRCNTWPKLRYTTQVGNRGGEVREEAEVSQYLFQDQLSGQEEQLLAQQTFNSAAPSGPLPLVCEEEFSAATAVTTPEVMGETAFTVQQQQSATTGLTPAAKSSSRRNPWGNLSYADLITQAIQGSPEKRLTLAQIYEWLVKNVAYFHGKGDSVSSMGWKNSIRHNLSLHSRFMRVQNEGAGKSSWWMLNPEVTSKPAAATATATSSSSSTSPSSAKPIRRRANTLDPARIEHRRKGGGKLSGRQARTPKDQLRRTLSNTSVLSDSVSLSVTDLTNPEQQQHRQRTSSSGGGGGCLSPAFRPRTFSNTSSSCDQSSPPGDEYSLDGTVPLSPCWNGSNSQYANVSSPLFNFNERLKLEDSVAAAVAAEQELTPEDLESLKLLDLELDPKSSQLLLEAIYQEVQDQQQQQEHTPSAAATAASILQQVFPNQQNTAVEVKEEFDGQMEEDVLPTSVVETNAAVIQLQPNGGVNVPSALLPPMVNGHKIKILEPREPSSNLMTDCNGTGSNNLISSYLVSPCDSSFLDMKQSRPVRGCAPLSWVGAEANNMQRELFLRKQQNEQRQLRQMKRIQEHQHRQQKLQQQQQQQSLMLSGGFVQTSNDRYPAATAVAAETDYHFQQQPSFDPNHSLTTVSESANENPYFDEFLRCNQDSEEFDFDFSPMEGVNPMVVGGFPGEETGIGGVQVKQEQLQQQEGSPGVSHLFPSAPPAEAASLGSC